MADGDSGDAAAGVGLPGEMSGGDHGGNNINYDRKGAGFLLYEMRVLREGTPEDVAENFARMERDQDAYLHGVSANAIAGNFAGDLAENLGVTNSGRYRNAAVVGIQPANLVNGSFHDLKYFSWVTTDPWAFLPSETREKLVGSDNVDDIDRYLEAWCVIRDPARRTLCIGDFAWSFALDYGGRFVDLRPHAATDGRVIAAARFFLTQIVNVGSILVNVIFMVENEEMAAKARAILDHAAKTPNGRALIARAEFDGTLVNYYFESSPFRIDQLASA